MGRKKKKAAKPWCWYCNREFEDEKILIQHQKAKHFKCHICNKKLFTGPGLAIHCMQVHKETIDKIPAAIPGRDSVEIEVYGMEGIPPEDDEPRAKQGRFPEPSSIPTPGMPPMPPGAAPYGDDDVAPVTSIPVPPLLGAGSGASIKPQPPPTPTFPAYQQTAVKEEPSSGANGAGDLSTSGSKPLSSRTRIVCPDETISLEERMAARLEAMSRSHYR
ncbi:zinc finger protein [Aphelenchoides avenae]|nr:zinc finger protein [Aphelenchus avenae]